MSMPSAIDVEIARLTQRQQSSEPFAASAALDLLLRTANRQLIRELKERRR